MFNKLLREEHRATTTSPNTRSSRGVSSSGDKRGKRSAATLPRSSSKRSRPSFSMTPPASSTRHAFTPSPPPKDYGGRSTLSFLSRRGGFV
ncbi:UNVERIFIED_CONTAM: hypothetical protein Sangu_1181600 [Sesamum angustifolium]|uniref:Uncharacterized protein n=1 Tax=Sesamum angustifolium TaxID=2727405 RepID=A0AAW2NIZ7_9LAMI